MGEQQVMAEVYQGRATGEPLATVTGSEARVLRKAAVLAAELGQPVEVVIAGGAQTWRITPMGTATRIQR